MKWHVFVVFILFGIEARGAQFMKECSDYETCIQGFSEAVLLTSHASDISQKLLHENWKLLLDYENLKMAEKFKTMRTGCTLQDQLVFAPAESPLGKVVRGHLKAMAALRKEQVDDQFIFDFDVQLLRDILKKQGAYGMTITGASTPDEVKALFEAQEEWKRKNTRYTLLFNENLKAFRKVCVKDKVKDWEELRNKILSESRDLDALQERFQSIKEECELIYRFNNKIGSRYENNETSSRYRRLKEMVLATCPPYDAVGFLAGQKKNCSQLVEDAYDIISPECESRGGSEKKGNLCNGLHRTLVKAFMENPAYDGYLASYIQKLNQLKASGRKGDLLELALSSTNGDRLAASRLVGLLGHDEINTSMKSIREALIQSGQFERLAKVDKLYTKEIHVFAKDDPRFKGTKIIEGNMTLFKDLLKSGSTVGGAALSGRYYHYIAGMVVSCELKARQYGSFISTSVARLAGEVYETFDFKSHIQNGVSFSASVDNYYRDSRKHAMGGKLGSSFCY